MSSAAEVVPEVTPAARSIIYLGMDVHKESITIARDLARAMRGDVTISSTAGQGTTAAVVLPAA